METKNNEMTTETKEELVETKKVKKSNKKDAVVPTDEGLWQMINGLYRECPDCGYKAHKTKVKEYKFCPNCGKKMIEDVELAVTTKNLKDAVVYQVLASDDMKRVEAITLKFAKGNSAVCKRIILPDNEAVETTLFKVFEHDKTKMEMRNLIDKTCRVDVNDDWDVTALFHKTNNKLCLTL